MNITITHSGKQHAYHVAKSLFDLGYLDKFITSSYISSLKIQEYLLKNKNKYWTRRFIEGLNGEVIDANWRFELKEIMLRKLQGKSTAVQDAIYQRDVDFDQYVARKLKQSKSDVFWGFQGSCRDSLQTANMLGKLSICELATAHVVAAKRILGEETKLHPEWADSIDNVVFPKDYEKRLEEEPHHADIVVAASTFTMDSLQEVGIKKQNIIKLPLGFDSAHIPYKLKEKSDIITRPLRLLYVGTVTQRKGIKYLLEAMKQLPKNVADLHIIGGIQGSGKGLKYYKNYFTYHPPINQKSLFQKYSQYDALILPSIFEGFGLVIVEAMAAGLPVITTPHTFGPDIIENGKNGYIIPVRDIIALVKAIGKLSVLSEEEYLEMRKNARASALSYSWKNYSERLRLLLAKLKKERFATA